MPMSDLYIFGGIPRMCLDFGGGYLHLLPPGLTVERLAITKAYRNREERTPGPHRVHHLQPG